MNDDLTLLREYARNNSEAAFATLASRYVNLVYSVALRQVRDPHLAGEITQVVFIILARKAGSLGGKTILPGWLCRTARYAGANALTIQRRRQQREQEAYMQNILTGGSDASSPQAQEDTWNQIAPLLDGAMEQLGQKDHDALVLRFFENKTFADVGASLGASEDAAKMRVNRALEKLRKFFTKRGVSSTTAIIAGIISTNSVQAAPVALAKSVTAVAMVKGAVASASTLTLIQGALKIMAWTKMKTTLAIGAAAIVGIGTTAVVVKSLLPVPGIQGAWEGTFVIPQPGNAINQGEFPKTRFVLQITETNGAYQGIVEDIDRGQRHAFDTVTYQYPYLHADTYPSQRGNNTMPDVYCVGKVDRSGEKMSWKSMQGTNAYAMEFRRTTSPTPFPEPLTDDECVPRTGSDLQGFWKGTIGTGTDALRIEFKIAEPSDGTFRADFYCPDQGTNRLPTSVSYNGTTAKLMLMAGYGMFQGELRNGGKEMVGDWIKDGHREPMTFTRAN